MTRRNRPDQDTIAKVAGLAAGIGLLAVVTRLIDGGRRVRSGPANPWKDWMRDRKAGDRKPPEAGIAVPAVPPNGPLPKHGGAEAPLDFDA